MSSFLGEGEDVGLPLLHRAHSIGPTLHAHDPLVKWKWKRYDSTLRKWTVVHPKQHPIL